MADRHSIPPVLFDLMAPPKKCSQCNELRPAAHYHWYNSHGKRRRRGAACKDCALAKVAAWKKNHPDRVRAKDRRTHLRKKFGMTEEAYRKMWDAQEGVCAICGKPERKPGKGGRIQMLSIDHCHTTGQVRGLLCHRCNVFVGFLESRENLLTKATVYLGKYLAKG